MEIKQTKQIIFTEEHVDITDPCYSKSVWCRINHLPIEQGTWYADYSIEPLNLVLTYQNHNSSNENFIRLGEIGTDSGLIGVFQDKPNYDTKDWKEFLKVRGIETSKDLLKCVGVCVPSGGDGTLTVYGHRDNYGLFTKIVIKNKE